LRIIMISLAKHGLLIYDKFYIYIFTGEVHGSNHEEQLAPATIHQPLCFTVSRQAEDKGDNPDRKPEEGNGKPPQYFPKTLMMLKQRNSVSDVSGSSLSGGAVSGRGGNRASQVVIMRNPYEGYLRIGTWNVRSLMKPESLECLKRDLTRHRVNIVGITEMRWHGTGDIWSDNFRIIYSGGQESQRGVGIMLDRATAGCVKQIECVSDRLMMVQINADPVDMWILCVYMPTSSHDEEEVEMVYDQMEAILAKRKGNEYLIILGDWNASVGEGKEGSVVGEYGLGKRNNRGRMMVPTTVIEIV